MSTLRIGFRTRLVLCFVLVAVIPIALLTFFYLRFATDTIEYWQNPGIERTINNSLAVARESLEHYRQEAVQAGEFLLVLLDPEADGAEVSRFLRNNASEVGLDLLAIYRREGGRWKVWAAGGAEGPQEELEPALAEAALSGSCSPPLDLESRSVCALLPVGEGDDVLLVGIQPPAEVMSRIRRLASDADLYRRLAGYERIQIATVVVGTVVLVALVVLASLIVSRMLGRSISSPILELVKGTRRVSLGDLDHPVQVRAKDEIGLLVGSFNQMTGDLRLSKENLRRAERVAAWRDVARRIAHEIKNPLTPVQLSIHRLRKRMPEVNREAQMVFTECLDLMDTEVANLRRLADEFSRFARMPQPNPVSSDLGELSGSVLDLYKELSAGVTVQLDIPDGLPRIPVDPDQYRQVLGNLIKNALEAMPSGGTIAVRLEKVAPPARPGVRVSVADSGPGLPVDIRDHVFEPYVTTRKRGSGLGLAIVHRIVTDHGGTVEVESEEGRGTVFRLWFPAGRGKEEA